MDLDRFNDFQKIDNNGIGNLIEEMPNQIESTWDQLSELILPAHYINVKNIYLIYPEEEYVSHELILPIINLNNLPIFLNSVPGNLNKDSLIIASSLYTVDDRINKIINYGAKLGAKILILSAGGELLSLSKKYRCPVYKYRPGAENIYSVSQIFLTIINVIIKLKIVEYKDDVDESLVLLKGLSQRIKPDVVFEKNIAKQIASLVDNCLPIMVGTKYSMPIIKRLSSMLSTNAKSFSVKYDINQFSADQIYKDILPDKVLHNIKFLIFHSKFNLAQDHIKLLSTCQILEKRRIRYETISIQPSGKIMSELLQGILLADYIAYYLAILNNTDPSDYVLKEQFDSMVESNIGHKIRKDGFL